MAGIEKGVTLRHIVRVLYGAFKGESVTRPVLGRFGMIDCEKTAKYKSELANEDHCGTCASYVLQKQDEITSMQSRNMSSIRSINNSVINPTAIHDNINRVEKSIKFYNKENRKNKDEDTNDDDDNDDGSSSGSGMITGNNTVFVCPHTVHPQRKYTSVANSNRMISNFHEDDENTDMIYKMLLADMNVVTPVVHSDYNTSKCVDQKIMYFV
jgi:hypothetical protein